MNSVLFNQSIYQGRSQSLTVIGTHLLFIFRRASYHNLVIAQWVRAFAQQAKGWVLESQPRQTYVVKSGSDSSTAKRSAIGVSVTGPRR